MPACSAPGPQLTPHEALRRLAGEPELRCLHGGSAGHTLVAWGGSAQALHRAEDLQPPPGSLPGAADPGAWGALHGGALVQLDYELPVGPWAWQSGDPGAQGRCWPLGAHLRWSPGAAACELVGAPAERAAMVERLAQPARELPAVRARGAPRPAWDRAGHRQRVEAIRAAIARGDLYQANLTCPIAVHLVAAEDLDLAVFLALQDRAPGGFAAFLRSAGRTVISHSPECFLLWQDGRVVSEPIKGTRPRRPGQEAAVRAELRASAKDRAELAMIVDLVRNDLGRCARVGGVRVADAERIIDLPYVHHLVARIEAVTRPGTDLAALLAATWPAGSITGAPKIAAMRLIRALEGRPRGAYCGAIGWCAAEACQLAVAIRTLEIRGDRARLQAGGGIVADSDGDAEWEELLAKAGPMLAALGCTGEALTRD